MVERKKYIVPEKAISEYHFVLLNWRISPYLSPASPYFLRRPHHRVLAPRARAGLRALPRVRHRVPCHLQQAAQVDLGLVVQALWKVAHPLLPGGEVAPVVVAQPGEVRLAYPLSQLGAGAAAAAVQTVGFLKGVESIVTFPSSK